MSDVINVETIDRGITDGLHTWEVIDADTGQTIGWNQSAEGEQTV